MIKKNSALFILFLISFAAITQNIRQSLYFETATSELKPKQKENLKQQLSEFNSTDFQKILIKGYADTVGNIPNNQILSEKRANAVREYFISEGIDKSIIQIKAYGEGSSTSAMGLALNRKVEIDYLPSDSQTNISQLYDILSSGSQQFLVNPNRDTTLIGEKGTIIHIKKGTFKLTKKQIESKAVVSFYLKEPFLKSEMILNNLSTMANNRILETMGMIYTGAFLESNIINLEKDITIVMPTDTIVEGAKMFDGARDPHSAIMNWAVSNNSVLRNFDINTVLRCRKYGDTWTICNEQYSSLPMDSAEQLDRCGNCLLNCLGQKETCRFFFCKLGRISKSARGSFSSSIRRMNVQFRKTQKKGRIARRLKKKMNRKGSLSDRDLAKIRRNFIREEAITGELELTENEKQILELTNVLRQSDDAIKDNNIDFKPIAECGELDSLFREYDVANAEELVLAINKPLLDEFGLDNMEDLLDTLPKVNLENIELAYRNKSISFDDYKFYIYNTSKLGWKNVDVFANIQDNQLTTVKVDETPSKTIDCKLVFKDREFVLSSKINKDHYYFPNIPKNEEAWLVGLKYENGIPSLSLEPIKTQNKTFTLNYKQLSLEELKEQLKILDFDN